MVDTSNGIVLIRMMNNLRNCDWRTGEERRHDTQVLINAIQTAGGPYYSWFYEIDARNKVVPSEKLYEYKMQLALYQLYWRHTGSLPASGLHWCDPTQPYKSSDIRKAQVKAMYSMDEDGLEIL
jgi:hypothetical protein